MNNTIRTIRKSMVMLFSFALVASILTVSTVGVNESENSTIPSKVVSAEAYTINLDGGESSVSYSKPYTSSCASSISSCGKKGGTKPRTPKPLPANQNVEYFACSSVSGSGNCSVKGVKTQDGQIFSKTCEYRLVINGNTAAYDGPGAVRYMKSILGDWWNPNGNAEAMFSYLTGYGLGTVAYPTEWSEVRNFGYNGVKPQAGSDGMIIGGYKFYCHENLITLIKPDKQTTKTCAPKNDGRPFPYATGYYVVYEDSQYFNAPIDLRGKKYKSFDWRIASGNCVYVAASTPPPKVKSKTMTCYWNISHIGRYSTSKSSIKSGGTPTSVAPKSPKQNAKKPSLVGKDSARKLTNCTTNVRMDASLSLKDGYAYYRLQANALKQTYQFYNWDSKYTQGRVLPADITMVGGPAPLSKSAYGIHSCHTNPPFKQYNSYGSMPGGVNFKYSDCYNGSSGKYGWDCKISAPKINGVNNNVQVMRDGSYVKVNLGGVNISGRGVRDVNGSAGKVSDSNLSYQVNLTKGSSPLNSSTTLNGGKQYFELWNANKTTETKWGQWLTKPNANKNSFLSFYWSSNNGESWSMNYQGKLNKVQFAVPYQNSTTSPVGTSWKNQNNVDCEGTKTSNKATVLRSVSSEG